jgi:ankyrin repeat protein
MTPEPPYINDPDALVTAAYEGELDLVRSLVLSGANPNVTNEHGDTGVMLAAEHGYDAIVEFLLDHGTEINTKDKGGDTALDIARYRECKSTVKLLISRGATGADGPSAKERMMDSFYEACKQANAIKLGRSKP